MESQLSLHLKVFNNRVKIMNQTNAKELILSKLDAQNLQANIFELLTQIQELAEIKKVQEPQDVVNIQMDGGDFR